MLVKWRTRAEAAAASAEAERTVERWNRAIRMGRDVWWSPTIRCAIVAGTPWLDVYCPRLQHAGLGRKSCAGLRCTWCPGSAPMPKITGLYALPPAGQATGAR